MTLIGWIILGALAGLLANLFVGKEDYGCCASIGVGMIGSIIGGGLIALMSDEELTTVFAFRKLNVISLLVSILGAVIFIGILRFAKKK